MNQDPLSLGPPLINYKRNAFPIDIVYEGEIPQIKNVGLKKQHVEREDHQRLKAMNFPIPEREITQFDYELHRPEEQKIWVQTWESFMVPRRRRFREIKGEIEEVSVRTDRYGIVHKDLITITQVLTACGEESRFAASVLIIKDDEENKKEESPQLSIIKKKIFTSPGKDQEFYPNGFTRGEHTLYYGRKAGFLLSAFDPEDLFDNERNDLLRKDGLFETEFKGFNQIILGHRSSITAKIDRKYKKDEFYRRLEIFNGDREPYGIYWDNYLRVMGAAALRSVVHHCKTLHDDELITTALKFSIELPKNIKGPLPDWIDRCRYLCIGDQNYRDYVPQEWEGFSDEAYELAMDLCVATDCGRIVVPNLEKTKKELGQERRAQNLDPTIAGEIMELQETCPEVFEEVFKYIDLVNQQVKANDVNYPTQLGALSGNSKAEANRTRRGGGSKESMRIEGYLAKLDFEHARLLLMGMGITKELTPEEALSILKKVFEVDIECLHIIEERLDQQLELGFTPIILLSIFPITEGGKLRQISLVGWANNQGERMVVRIIEKWLKMTKISPTTEKGVTPEILSSTQQSFLLDFLYQRNYFEGYEEVYGNYLDATLATDNTILTTSEKIISHILDAAIENNQFVTPYEIERPLVIRILRKATTAFFLDTRSITIEQYCQALKKYGLSDGELVCDQGFLIIKKNRSKRLPLVYKGPKFRGGRRILEDIIKLLEQGKKVLITGGTGSGKTMSVAIAIIEYALENGITYPLVRIRQPTQALTTEAKNAINKAFIDLNKDKARFTREQIESVVSYRHGSYGGEVNTPVLFLTEGALPLSDEVLEVTDEIQKPMVMKDMNEGVASSKRIPRVGISANEVLFPDYEKIRLKGTHEVKKVIHKFPSKEHAVKAMVSYIKEQKELGIPMDILNLMTTIEDIYWIQKQIPPGMFDEHIPIHGYLSSDQQSEGKAERPIDKSTAYHGTSILDQGVNVGNYTNTGLVDMMRKDSIHCPRWRVNFISECVPSPTTVEQIEGRYGRKFHSPKVIDNGMEKVLVTLFIVEYDLPESIGVACEERYNWAYLSDDEKDGHPGFHPNYAAEAIHCKSKLLEPQRPLHGNHEFSRIFFEASADVLLSIANRVWIAIFCAMLQDNQPEKLVRQRRLASGDLDPILNEFIPEQHGYVDIIQLGWLMLKHKSTYTDNFQTLFRKFLKKVTPRYEREHILEKIVEPSVRGIEVLIARGFPRLVANVKNRLGQWRNCIDDPHWIPLSVPDGLYLTELLLHKNGRIEPNFILPLCSFEFEGIKDIKEETMLDKFYEVPYTGVEWFLPVPNIGRQNKGQKFSYTVKKCSEGIKTDPSPAATQKFLQKDLEKHDVFVKACSEDTAAERKTGWEQSRELSMASLKVLSTLAVIPAICEAINIHRLFERFPFESDIWRKVGITFTGQRIEDFLGPVWAVLYYALIHGDDSQGAGSFSYCLRAKLLKVIIAMCCISPKSGTNIYRLRRGQIMDVPAGPYTKDSEGYRWYIDCTAMGTFCAHIYVPPKFITYERNMDSNPCELVRKVSVIRSSLKATGSDSWHPTVSIIPTHVSAGLAKRVREHNGRLESAFKFFFPLMTGLEMEEIEDIALYAPIPLSVDCYSNAYRLFRALSSIPKNTLKKFGFKLTFKSCLNISLLHHTMDSGSCNFRGPLAALLYKGKLEAINRRRVQPSVAFLEAFESKMVGLSNEIESSIIEDTLSIQCYQTKDQLVEYFRLSGMF